MNYILDQHFDKFVICMGLMTKLIGYAENWNQKGKPKLFVFNGHQMAFKSGFKFDRQFTTFIKNSKKVFRNEEERNDFLQVVLNCQYMWDQCIANYCNKHQ